MLAEKMIPKASKRFGALLFLRWPFILLGVVAVLHILKVIQLEGYCISLIIIVFLPSLQSIVSKYFKTFKIGKDGIEATTIADNEGRERAANSAEPRHGTFPYSIDSRRILTTLWHNKVELFGEDSLRRWGFGVGIGATDYSEYTFIFEVRQTKIAGRPIHLVHKPSALLEPRVRNRPWCQKRVGLIHW